MDIRKLLILFGIWIVFFLWAWVYIIFSLLASSQSSDMNQANIIQGPNEKENKLNQTYETWTINENFQDKQSDNLNSNKIDEFSWELLVVVPRYFFSTSFKLLKKNIEQNTDIRLKYILYDDFNQLERLIKLNKFDIFLLPYEISSNYLGYFEKVNIQNPNKYKSMLHPLFLDYFFSNDFTFFPYGIDPFVSFVYKDLNIEYPLDILNIRKFFIKNKIYYKPLAILFGIDNIIIKNYLEKSKELYQDYNLILYYLIYYSVLAGDENIISTIISWSTNPRVKLWSYASFLRNKNILSKKNKYCSKYPKICLAAYNKSFIFFGRLSDLDKMNIYFKDSSTKIKDWQIYNFPYYNTNNYPVSLRWFVINKNSDNKNKALYFITKYIDSINKYYWKNILSAFENIYEEQKLNKKYVKIVNYEYDFESVENYYKFEKLINQSRLLDALKWNYDIKLLINDPNFVDLVIK